MQPHIPTVSSLVPFRPRPRPVESAEPFTTFLQTTSVIKTTSTPESAQNTPPTFTPPTPESVAGSPPQQQRPDLHPVLTTSTHSHKHHHRRLPHLSQLHHLMSRFSLHHRHSSTAPAPPAPRNSKGKRAAGPEVQAARDAAIVTFQTVQSNWNDELEAGNGRAQARVAIEEGRVKDWKDMDSDSDTGRDHHEPRSPLRFLNPDELFHAKERRRAAIEREIEEEETWNEGLRSWNARRELWTGSAKDREKHWVKVPRCKSRFADNPLNDVIDESLYPELYKRLVKAPVPPAVTNNLKPASSGSRPSTPAPSLPVGMSTSIPINLSIAVSAIVQGWKDDGEWPPRPSAPEANFTHRKPASAPPPVPAHRAHEEHHHHHAHGSLAQDIMHNLKRTFSGGRAD
ncbi:hypothetical protein BJ508DRAFT_321873 [Ascobolus immersus RN42]|uniref:Gag1-like clamp domain-containing protein n=1 Tax=Ascobolus immersus RN42 TaxID=1160509 RepID=A0A3N4IJ84_ASCIM|nr:hypothetical protein BJ508DRAFT_321873 [Ascobolus immersus RN42]